MDIKKYNYPKPTQGMDIDKKLLKEAIKRGFYRGDTEFNLLFHRFIAFGGVLRLKPGLNSKFRETAVFYLKALMGASFVIKHEEKEAVSALLLSELVELDYYKKVIKDL